MRYWGVMIKYISPRQSVQVDIGVVVGLKEQTAMLVQGSSVDKPEGKKGNSCSFNIPLNTLCPA